MKVAFIGLGVQGKYLAINEAAAGFAITACDLNPAALDEAAQAGAQTTIHAAQAASGADVVQVCVLNDAQVRAVTTAQDGVLGVMAPGSLLVIHSTVHPDTIAQVAQQAAALGIEVADVPVSGSQRGAMEKTMSFMAGCSEAALERIMPLLHASGEKVAHVGGPGTGIRAKLAHQLIACVNILSAAEGMRLGVAAGVDIATLRAVVSAGVGQSWMADRWQAMRFNPTARAVFAKDLALCLDYGRTLGLDLPAAELALARLEEILP